MTVPGPAFFRIQVALCAFGASRLMFGSDWPVCTLAQGVDHRQTAQLLLNILEDLGVKDPEPLKLIFSENCRRFYNL